MIAFSGRTARPISNSYTMGTDSVKLFNKTQADQIFGLAKLGLIQFVEIHLDELRHREKAVGFVHSQILFQLKEKGGSVAQAINQLMAEKISLRHLKEELVSDFAFGTEEILLDYWGCWAEVFHERPAGSISSRKYLGDEEERYVFLLPAHVSQMIQSLKKHADDLSVMKKADIERLEYFRDFCQGHPGYWVAYIFDF